MITTEIPKYAFTDPVEAAKQFRNTGGIVMRGVFDPEEILALRNEVVKLEESVVAGHIEGEDNTWRDGRLWTMYALIDRLGAPFRALVGHPRILEVVEEILGPGFSWMCRSPVTVKRDGDGIPIPWHRDWQDVPEGMDPELFHSKPHLIACTIPLDAYTEKTCFWAYPGSQHVSMEESYALAKGRNEPFSADGAIPLIADVGDLIVHDYFVMHGSAGVGAGMSGRRGLIHAYWSRELAEFTQNRFPQHDLRLEDRQRLIATCIEERQHSPYNNGEAPFQLADPVQPFPRGASLRTPHWHYGNYTAAEPDITNQ